MSQKQSVSMLAVKSKTNPVLEYSLSDVADSVVDQWRSVHKAVLINGKLRVWSERVERLVDSLDKVHDNCNQVHAGQSHPAQAGIQCRINHVADVANATGLRPQGGLQK